MSSVCKSILVVSDSLGRPLHPRGIFHYTSNLIRALHTCGHDVCLLIERPLPSPARLKCKDAFASSAHTTNLAEIYRNLGDTELASDLRMDPGANDGIAPRLRLKLFAAIIRLTHLILPVWKWGLRLAMGMPVTLEPQIVANDTTQIEPMPDNLHYLRAVSSFAVVPAIYQINTKSAGRGSNPVTIDARNFDIILVDTPTNLAFSTKPGAEVVSVIHDLIPLTDKERGRYWRRVFATKLATTIRVSNSFIFVSEYTRREVAQHFPQNSALISESRILYPSVDDDIADGIGGGSRAATVTKKIDGNPDSTSANITTDESSLSSFVLIASDELRKNVANAIAAFSLLPQGCILKIVGQINPKRYGFRDGSHSSGPRPGKEQRTSQIQFLGYVSDVKKREILASATGVIVPSLHEGFGIPLVEGSFFGKPVFCSDISPFREIFGEHGIYFDPHSPQSIAETIKNFVADPQRYQAQIVQAAESCRRRFSRSSLTAEVARCFGDARLNRE